MPKLWVLLLTLNFGLESFGATSRFLTQSPFVHLRIAGCLNLVPNSLWQWSFVTGELEGLVTEQRLEVLFMPEGVHPETQALVRKCLEERLMSMDTGPFVKQGTWYQLTLGQSPDGEGW